MDIAGIRFPQKEEKETISIDFCHRENNVITQFTIMKLSSIFPLNNSTTITRFVLIVGNVGNTVAISDFT